MAADAPTIAVLGASGLIGHAVALDLMDRGFPVAALARRFTRAQKAALGDAAVEAPLVDLDARGLATLLAGRNVDILVNCIGVLQDMPGKGTAADAHGGFVSRLLAAMGQEGARPQLLVQLSIPGAPEGDRTAFSATKREAERLISDSTVPFAILRPGFVVAPVAYGGSALIRGLAALPVRLPQEEASRPFAATDVADISRSIAVLAEAWGQGRRDWRETWDVMERRPHTVGEVVEAFRARIGGPVPRWQLPGALLSLGARAGDLAARLGWAPPVRSTALAELRRGVAGDPAPWSAATSLEPRSLEAALARCPAGVQELWFARLYMLKPAILGILVVFWFVSGLIALTVAFEAAVAILTAHAFPPLLAKLITVVTSLADMSIGAAIAVRRSCRAGLLAGIALSLFYMAGAAVLTPEMWIEPLGALVKTGPAIVLMLVALAILDDR
ncbi:SDR family oxidoreductase [Stappia indica]|uniref:NAD(P)H-binding protein n=1 Tax=Stappia indica TaxID=538381 RepID=A0A857C4B7_9HYPH|nr:SDR family oxidoreductase [Stappia indica]QGZ33803.1 NAD(P)H-binding protein [Stappia indica]